MKYQIRNITRQVLNLEGGITLLGGQTIIGEKTFKIETYEQRGYVALVEQTEEEEKLNSSEENKTEPIEAESVSTGVSRIVSNEIEPLSSLNQKNTKEPIKETPNSKDTKILSTPLVS